MRLYALNVSMIQSKDVKEHATHFVPSNKDRIYRLRYNGNHEELFYLIIRYRQEVLRSDSEVHYLEV